MAFSAPGCARYVPNGLVASDEALAGKVLLELECFAGKGLSDAADTAVMQWRQSAEMQFAFFKITLSNALVLTVSSRHCSSASWSFLSSDGARRGVNKMPESATPLC